MSFLDSLGSLFTALFDPQQAASAMAAQGVTPEDIQNQVQNQKTIGNLSQPFSDAQRARVAGDIQSQTQLNRDQTTPTDQNDTAGAQGGGGGIGSMLGNLITGAGSGLAGIEQSALGKELNPQGNNSTPMANMALPQQGQAGGAQQPAPGAGQPTQVPFSPLPPQMLQNGQMPSPSPSGTPGGSAIPPVYGNMPTSGAPQLPQTAPVPYASNPEGGVGGAVSPNQAPNAAGAAAAQSATPIAPSGSIKDIITKAAQKYGVDPNYLITTAGIESNFNPNAYNKASGASGLFQFIPGTAKQYGLKDPFNAQQNADAAARLTAQNEKYFQQQFGRAPTPQETYLMHQQGPGGATALLKNPNAAASSIVGSNAVTMNGGNANMTAQQYTDLWTQRYNRLSQGGAQQQQNASTSGQQASASGTPASGTPTKSKTKDLLGTIGQAIKPFSDAGDNKVKPPAPVAPQRGSYEPDPQGLQLMLSMLAPGANKAAQIPSLSQLLAGVK